MEQPSTRHRTIETRSAMLSLFILNIMLDYVEIVKHNVHVRLKEFAFCTVRR